MHDEYSIWNFDKLKDIKEEDLSFCFSCFKCKSKNIDLNPLNVCFKTEGINNSDLPLKQRKYYDLLPIKRDAILSTLDNGEVHLTCLDCPFSIRLPKNVPRSLLKKWLLKKYPSKEIIT